LLNCLFEAGKVDKSRTRICNPYNGKFMQHSTWEPLYDPLNIKPSKLAFFIEIELSRQIRIVRI